VSTTLRRATPADTTAIAALLAASYEDNPKADPDVLRWQYWANPFGAARSWVAERDGRLVSHWAAIPVPLRVEGRTVRAAKGVDIATLPAHRRQGLFARVAASLLDDCRDLDVLLTHPNPASAAAVERAGAALIGRAAAHVRLVDAGFLARRAHVPVPIARLVGRLVAGGGVRGLGGGVRGLGGGVRGLGGVLGGVRGRDAGGADAVGLAHEPPAALDGLWAAVGASQPTGIVRDAAWWDWRYARRPGSAYRYVTVTRDGALAGAAVLTVRERYGGRFGLVCELLAVDERAARGLRRGAEDVARAERADGLAAVALPATPQARLLTSAGMRRVPRRLEPRPLRVMVATPGTDAGPLAALAWTMSWGDLDHL
jgi:GNAT superfamily N-acetyltransferase